MKPVQRFDPHQPHEVESFKRLKTWLIQETGLSYYLNKDDELRDKILERLHETPYDSFTSYLEQLQLEGPELQHLIQRLTIGETYFFRYREQFELLEKQILPELIEARRPEARLSIWSAGCSSGEEIYSLSILLKTAFPELGKWQIELLGTDLNRKFLSIARRGCYREWSFRQNPPEFKQSHFSQDGNFWQLLPLYREGVSFEPHNLIQQDFTSLNPQGFDLILCRNVLIYFDAATQQRLIQQFHDSLRPSGWLLLGPSELSALASQPFESQALASMSCFRKNGPDHPPARPMYSFTQSAASLLPASPRQPTPSRPSQAHKPVSVSPAESPHDKIRKLADTGQMVAAEAACRQRLAADSLDTGSHFALAQILTSLGRDPEAEAALKQVLYLDRKHVLAYYQLGLLQQKSGNFQAAGKTLANAERLLAGLPQDQPLADADGMTVAQLATLIQLQQKGLT